MLNDIAFAQRAALQDVTDFSRVFRESPLTVGDIHAGDFVNVAVERRGERLTATSVTVTLRSGARP